MSNITAPETAQTEETVAKKRKWLLPKRTDRKGALGSTELLQLLAVVAIIALLGGGVLLLINALKSSGEHSVVQRNIENVATITDTYWNSFAADNDGRRKVTPFKLCQYVNSQMNSDEVNFRTLQVVDAAGVPADDTMELVPRLGYRIASTGKTEAVCPTAITDLDNSYADILVFTATQALTDTNVVAGSADGITDADKKAGYSLAGAVGTPGAGVLQTALEGIDLLSTNTVWMAQFGASGTAGGFARLPDGTDGTFDADGAGTAAGAEYIVLGGQAPDGASFCMVKVFDAADNDQIGNYYLARAPQDGAAANHFTACLGGIPNAELGGLPNEFRRGSWPEPQ